MLRALVLSIVISVMWTSPLRADAHFYGRPFSFKWDDPKSREMTLLSDMGFVDAAGQDWAVKAPFSTDGASIPRAAWTIIGGPFEGPHRDAAIVHDYYCVHRVMPWRKVHRMFYEASLNAGTDIITAKVMYAAVYLAGPRWGELGGQTRGPGAAASESEQGAHLKEIQNWIINEQPSLEQIDSRLDGVH